MNTIKKEPALFAGAVAAALSLLVLYGVLDAEKAAGWQAFALALIPVGQMLASWFTRQKVMPVATVKEAGYDPDEVKERAGDPEIRAFKEDA